MGYNTLDITLQVNFLDFKRRKKKIIKGNVQFCACLCMHRAFN